MTLASFKVAWSSSRTKRYTPRKPDNTADCKSYQKYLQRPGDDEELTFVECLRIYDDTPATAKRYTSGNTLVGVKYLSVMNDVYFFQYLLMNYSHRNLSELEHPDSWQMPSHLVDFAAAQLLLPKLPCKPL